LIKDIIEEKMIKSLIIYDSVFGNTERIAQAIAKALGDQPHVALLKVIEIDLNQLIFPQLLIVGSPTRGFQPTPAIKKFLKSIPPQRLQGIKVAAFDTRIAVSDINSTIGRFFVRRFGYAADPIAKWLVKKGGELLVPPEGFCVMATKGPLKEGECERTVAWVKQIIKNF
jgi:flavodoxin I